MELSDCLRLLAKYAKELLKPSGERFVVLCVALQTLSGVPKADRKIIFRQVQELEQNTLPEEWKSAEMDANGGHGPDSTSDRVHAGEPNSDKNPTMSRGVAPLLGPAHGFA